MNSLVKKTGTQAAAAMLVVLMAAPLSALGAEVPKGSLELLQPAPVTPTRRRRGEGDDDPHRVG
ncbi:MAG TPA: hypothetical protein VLA91_02570 [Acidimicrobiia bacterium]|nr:hypothetical protein [Acidimicrobiia bacterium]